MILHTKDQLNKNQNKQHQKRAKRLEHLNALGVG